MVKITQEIWREGFKAGQGVVECCPYPAGSTEAHTWHNGYGIGLFKGPVQPATAPKRPASGWRWWLARLLGY
jgi:hypothetical protein